jgi:hypothetical protein
MIEPRHAHEEDIELGPIRIEAKQKVIVESYMVGDDDSRLADDLLEAFGVPEFKREKWLDPKPNDGIYQVLSYPIHCDSIAHLSRFLTKNALDIQGVLAKL